MKFKNFGIYIAVIVLVQLPCFAVPWSNKPLPRIDSHTKIDYVNINWWDNFSDSWIKYYINKAIENNHDAKQASWKVEQYKQAIKLQFSQELPSLSVGGSYLGAHFPDNLNGIKNNLFFIPFQANYEADVFLKNHDKTRSSAKAYVASWYQEKGIYISLAADVATTYINLVKFDKQIQIQKSLLYIKGQEYSREIAKYKRGIVSIPELNNYKKAFETAKSNLSETEKLKYKTLDQLAVLTGESPANIASIQRGSFDNLNYCAVIPNEISSESVFSRPDIMAAEENLEKSQIDIRVARKEFLPKINLTGLYSLDNVGPDGFGTWGSTIAGILASATLDLFKGGQKVANLKTQKTVYEQMFEAYRQADLNALKEVNDSMFIIIEDTKIDINTNKNFVTQKDNYRRAANSYKNGVITYPAFLNEEEQLLNMEQSKMNTKTARLVDYITLYKAVGGKL